MLPLLPSISNEPDSVEFLNHFSLRGPTLLYVAVA